MPYLAQRIPFLLTLNFNAIALRWPPYSSCCFDIVLHFLVCARARFCVALLFLGESEKRSVCTSVHYCVLDWRDWTLCASGALPVLGASADVERERESRSPGPGWVGDERRVELGVPLKPPLQIRGAERGSKWLVLCGWCKTLKSQSHLQHSLHQVH